MGIFDDAIREHLELKRHSGVDEEELKELEDEAFGPAARPGEPDFPGTSEEDALESDDLDSGGVFDAETDEAKAPTDAVVETPAGDEPALRPIDEAAMPGTDQPSAEPEEVDEAVVPEEPVAFEEAEPEASEPDTGAELEAAEVAEEQPDAAPGEASSFTTAEREAIADQPTVFFEQQPPAEMELGDLELDLDEEIEDVGGAVSEPLPEEDETLIVEEAFSEPAAETEVAEPPHEAEPEPEDLEPRAEDEVESTEPATGDDDVLEETPEFLRDNPDDDELWFEQGEPKDFDF